MVKKSIIVDSVDVSRCDYYTQGKCYKIDARECECDNSFDLITPCNGFPNCMYKELQRKKQECEELKEKLLKTSGALSDTLSVVEDMAILLGLDKEDHFEITKCYYKVKAYKQALECLAEYQKRNCETCTFANTFKCNYRCQVFVILNINYGLKGGDDVK